jgi:hypothetical protein
MKSPKFNCFGARFVKLFTLQKVEAPKTKKHTICKNDMFYVYGMFSTNGMKIKEIEAYWHFACIFDRHAKTFATEDTLSGGDLM